MADSHDKELGVLKTVLERESVHQRDIAEVVGMSVGMTNAIVKRLSKKGLLTVRKINNRNIRYAVTPDGVEEIAKRTYRYLKSTIKNVVDYKEAVSKVIRRAAREGYTEVLLIGPSDVDFIVEHQCAKHGLHFDRAPAQAVPEADAGRGAAAGTVFHIYAEGHTPPLSATRGAEPDSHAPAPAENVTYLRDVLAGV